MSILFFVATYKGYIKKKNHEILAALQYKPLYNISRSEKWGKKIQAAAYNGACRAHELTVLILYIPSTVVVAT